MLSKKSISLIDELCDLLRKKFDYLPEFEKSNGEIDHILYKLVDRLEDNDPYFHPNYIGHMSSYVHDVAIVSEMLAMQLNPNNHSYDGGRATTNMELECINEIANMFGWRNVQGHLTSGGTIANLEALWVARELGATKIMASKESHFTHKRISNVLGMDYVPIDITKKGRMSINSFEEAIRSEKYPRKVVVVITLGTTMSGAVDPLDKIVALRSKYNFFLHADAAYGGYFSLVREFLSLDSSRAFNAVSGVDSIVVNPHKHGMQAFGCGSVIFNNKNNSVYEHDSPYTYFDNSDFHFGKISLECSRSGSVAAALWATMQALPLTEGGEFSTSLVSSLRAAQIFSDLIDDSLLFNSVYGTPDLDIVVFYPDMQSSNEISKASNFIFETARKHLIYLALVEVNTIQLGFSFDSSVVCLRAVFMKKEHEGLVLQFFNLIQDILNEYFEVHKLENFKE